MHNQKQGNIKSFISSLHLPFHVDEVELLDDKFGNLLKPLIQPPVQTSVDISSNTNRPSVSPKEVAPTPNPTVNTTGQTFTLGGNVKNLFQAFAETAAPEKSLPPMPELKKKGVFLLDDSGMPKLTTTNKLVSSHQESREDTLTTTMGPIASALPYIPPVAPQNAWANIHSTSSLEESTISAAYSYQPPLAPKVAPYPMPQQRAQPIPQAAPQQPMPQPMPQVAPLQQTSSQPFNPVWGVRFGTPQNPQVIPQHVTQPAEESNLEGAWKRPQPVVNTSYDVEISQRNAMLQMNNMTTQENLPISSTQPVELQQNFSVGSVSQYSILESINSGSRSNDGIATLKEIQSQDVQRKTSSTGEIWSSKEPQLPVLWPSLPQTKPVSLKDIQEQEIHNKKMQEAQQAKQQQQRAKKEEVTAPQTNISNVTAPIPTWTNTTQTSAEKVLSLREIQEEEIRSKKSNAAKAKPKQKETVAPSPAASKPNKAWTTTTSSGQTSTWGNPNDSAPKVIFRYPISLFCLHSHNVV
jgi:hypothetical protein